MPARSLPWFLAAVAALLPCRPACAEPVADEKPTTVAKAPQPRTDLNGDPLPPGAVARLGAARMCQQAVLYLAFSPDDKTVAALDNGSLRLWDVQNGREVRHFDDPLGAEYLNAPDIPLAFSADGKLVALICSQNTVRVWETATGREVHTFQNLPATPSVLAFDPKGRLLAAGGRGPMLLWNLKDGKQLPSGDPVPLMWMAFTADGTKLIASVVTRMGPAAEEKIFHMNVSDGTLVREAACPSDGQHWGTPSPDGALFVMLTKDGQSLHLLSTSDGKELRLLEGKADHPKQVCFSGDGRFLTAASGDGVVRVWGVADGKVVHEFKAPGGVERVALSHDGKLLAAAGPADDAIHIWDLEQSKEMHSFAGHRSGPLSVVFSRDGKSVFTTNREGFNALLSRPPAEWSLREWDPATGKERRVVKQDLRGRVVYADFSHDGRLLALVMQDGTLRLRDPAAGKELRRWNVPVAAVTYRDPDGRIDSQSQAVIREPQFSPDDRVLYAGDTGRYMIHCWNTTTGEELSSLQTPDGAIAGIALPSPAGDNTVLVTEMGLGTCHMTLMDATTGQVVRQLWEGKGVRYAWDMSPDGRTLAVSEGGAPSLVEVASGRGRGRLENDVGKTANLMFSPDGRLLAVVGENEVRLLRVATGELVGRLEGCGSQADCLAFSPDSKRLAVSEGRNTVLIYDVDALAATVPAPAALSENEVAGFWNDLSAADGARAFRALGRLSADPVRVVAFVKARWKPAPELDVRRIERLLTELDDDDFAVREKATEELERHTPKTEEAMRHALQAGASAEAAHRIHQIMKDLQTPQTSPPSPELANLRVVELLETCGTDGARELLRTLSKGPADDQLTHEAREALRRLTATARVVSPP